MNSQLKYFLSDFEQNGTIATIELIDEVQKQLGFELPKDYVSLMLEINGGEGEIGENSWLCLFPAEDLVKTNEAYGFLMNQIPDFSLFGKDAADTGYAFHKQNKTIHSFGLMSNFKTDPIEFCGNDFIEFIKYLYNY